MISASTKAVGLIGKPVTHSVSPPMHNAAFEELGLEYVYLAFEVSENSLSDAVSGLRSLGLEGANVTIPHKTAVMEHLEGLDKTAEKIGAVNTIDRDGERLVGYNTDGLGAQRSLETKVDSLEGKNVLLLGAGGAGRAIAFTLAQAGSDLTISNRTASKAEELASEIEAEVGVEVGQVPLENSQLRKNILESEILINSTSVGMHPNEDETLVEAEDLHSDLIVMDIVYNPILTRLLEEAEEAGAETIDGLEMLVRQGAASFEIWTGEKPPIKTMGKAARKAVEEKP